MVKILIIQERGRHEKNREFRESLNFKRAFDRLGVPCVVWGLGYENFKIPFEEIQKDCDVFLLLENYEIEGWLPDLAYYTKMKVFWSIDSHWNLKGHQVTCDVHKIDILLNSTFGYLKDFSAPGRSCVYFPNCYPSDLIKPLDIPKTVNVGFCGNLVNRGEWLTFLKNEMTVKFDNFVIGDDMVRAVNSYKIHWNRNIADDVNYRTFETLGCRTFLLTNETDMLRSLFKIGEHLVTYDTPLDCLGKIQYYLRNEKEREEIAAAGHEHVLKHHTYDIRAKQFLEIIGA